MQAQSKKTTPKTKVLLVEDDYAIAQLYKLKLEMQDFEVIISKNGLEGLHELSKSIPEIILLDLKMPIMGGEEFLIKIRKNPDYKEIINYIC